MEELKIQTYQDGILSIKQIKLQDPADAMKEQTEILQTLFGKLYYDERTVGMTRFFQGKQSDVKVDRLLRCPRQKNVRTTHVVVTEDGQQYHIRQIQYPKEVEPESMDLTLEVLKTKMQVETEIVEPEAAGGDEDAVG